LTAPLGAANREGFANSKDLPINAFVREAISIAGVALL
jgi:hypothetical protein